MGTSKNAISNSYLGEGAFAFRAALHDVSGVAPHDHEFLEIALVVSGSARHGSLHGETTARSGDVYILRPGVWHSYSRCRELRVFNCVFALDLLHLGLAAALHDARLHHLLFGATLAHNRRGLLQLHLDEKTRGRCVRLLQKIERRPTLDSEKLALLLMFLSELAQVAAQHERGAPEYSGAKGAIPAAVEKARLLLESEPTRDWNLRELATALHLDRFHLSRLFKAHIGLPPMAYLNRYRAERAAQLLLRDDKSIAEIGAQVGWTDANLFARRFRAHFGLSPRNYRRQWAKEG